MKLYLDDERLAPFGWIQTKTCQETIEWLKSGKVTELSLDHDLGQPENGSGYDVLLWIEEQMASSNFVPPTTIVVHSANPVGKQKMNQTIESILHYTT